jgi:NADPH2:quinone reductase
VAGVIDAVGAGVTGLEPGMRVLGLVDRGGYAEMVVARADDVVVLPDHVDDNLAAGFAVAYGTAYGGLVWRAQLHAGETLLVHGAAGGVGLHACEVGRALGGRVIATARGRDRAQLALQHGAELAFDSESPNLVDELKAATRGIGADVVFDPVGGRLFDASLRLIAWEGRIILIGFASGEVPQIPANRLLVKNAAALGFYWGSYRRHDPARLRESLKVLFRWLKDGLIHPHVSHVLPLSHAAEALDLLRERKSTGKVVLTTLGA